MDINDPTLSDDGSFSPDLWASTSDDPEMPNFTVKFLHRKKILKIREIEEKIDRIARKENVLLWCLPVKVDTGLVLVDAKVVASSEANDEIESWLFWPLEREFDILAPSPKSRPNRM